MTVKEVESVCKVVGIQPQIVQHAFLNGTLKQTVLNVSLVGTLAPDVPRVSVVMIHQPTAWSVFLVFSVHLRLLPPLQVSLNTYLQAYDYVYLYPYAGVAPTSSGSSIAVVGGAVGGAAVLIILLLVVLCVVIVIMTLQLRRQRRKFTVAGNLYS